MFSRTELEKISSGKTVHLTLPAPPLLLLDFAAFLNDKEIECRYNFKDNLLVDEIVPLSLLIELGQANMLLVDRMGLYKNDMHYRALGGDIFIQNAHVLKDTELKIHVQIKKTLNVSTSTIVVFDVDVMNQDGSPILTVRDFKSIFVLSELIYKKGEVYERPDLKLVSLFKGDYQTIRNYTSFHELSYGENIIYSKRFLSEDEWFYKVHFANDPCAPGNLIGQSVYDTVSYYFKNVEHQRIQFEFIKAVAKANILPHNKLLEIYCFIEGQNIRADIICDGILSFKILDMWYNKV